LVFYKRKGTGKMDNMNYGDINYDNLDKNSTLSEFNGDFDRGMVPMICDKEDCTYGLPHYHCRICGMQVNSDELRRDYHPCCSKECIRIWNQQYQYPPF